MFYFVRLHHWHYGDEEKQFDTFELMSDYLLYAIHNGWAVTYIKQMNGGGDGIGDNYHSDRNVYSSRDSKK